MELTLGSDFVLRLLINTLCVVILIRFCYYKFSQHRANASSFMLFGIGVFLVTSLLHSAEVSMGFAFGLFAVSSVDLYRIFRSLGGASGLVTAFYKLWNLVFWTSPKKYFSQLFWFFKIFINNKGYICTFSRLSFRSLLKIPYGAHK